MESGGIACGSIGAVTSPMMAILVSQEPSRAALAWQLRASRNGGARRNVSNQLFDTLANWNATLKDQVNVKEGFYGNIYIETHGISSGQTY
jgi:hypothetical protein